MAPCGRASPLGAPHKPLPLAAPSTRGCSPACGPKARPLRPRVPPRAWLRLGRDPADTLRRIHPLLPALLPPPTPPRPAPPPPPPEARERQAASVAEAAAHAPVPVDAAAAVARAALDYTASVLPAAPLCDAVRTVAAADAAAADAAAAAPAPVATPPRGWRSATTKLPPAPLRPRGLAKGEPVPWEAAMSPAFCGSRPLTPMTFRWPSAAFSCQRVAA
mmetsp:Transcript_113027/g.319794  ORF Transcript_113027/g.319794 Transcript_113027/m.319794 type:complete len:219 (+) Transcript_113027:183-839(+)